MNSRRYAFRATGIVLRSMWHRAEGRFSLLVLGVWILVSLVSVFWTPWSLWWTDGYHVWQKPSMRHLLGTDGTGADVLSWLMAGSRTNLLICVLTVAVTAIFGLLLLAAMLARATIFAQISVVVIDALISLPTVLIALILAVPFGPSVAVIVAACGFGYGLNLARIARPQALLIARSGYVESALSNGARASGVFLRHIVPNIMPVLTVQLSISAGTVVLAESGLTYLGIGVQSGVPSWGHSLATSVSFINIYPLTVLWPGLIITCIVLSLNLCGDTLRDCADPLSNVQLRNAQFNSGQERSGQVRSGQVSSGQARNDQLNRVTTKGSGQ
ncbi:MAG: ABC transporter permease [Bifidobacterium aquikefiri]